MPIPILAKIGSWLGGGIIESAGKVAVDVGKTYFGDKTEKEQHLSAEQLAVLNQYAAEFVARTQRTWWDSFVDGLNRFIRPGLAIGAQLAFVWVWWDPVGFAECMRALQLVPDMLWILWATIISFYYGGRIIEKSPIAWKVEPKAIELAKEIAAERTERARAEAAEKATEAARAAAEAAETAGITAAAAAEKDIEVAEKRIEVEKERQATATARANGDGKEENPTDVPTPDDITQNYRVSERGLTLIRKFEGFQDRAYVCPGGALTIGYGHVIRKGEPYGNDGYVMEELVATEVLDRDCDIAENTINQLVDVPLTQNQFDALVSLAFNIGVSAFSKSTLLKKINQGDHQGAAAEFSRWVNAKGKLLPGLARRRTEEQSLFLEQ